MFKKGHPNYNLKVSEETRKKISEGHMGIKPSKEARKKMSDSRLGKEPWNKNRKEIRIDVLKKQSESHKGLDNHQKGRKCTEEVKRKMSEYRKKNPVNYWLGKKRPPFSEEWRRNMSETRKGENNPSWIDGRTPENQKIRHSIETDLWREAVFARDNWTCQKTGVKGGKLHPHHIQGFAQFPELRFAIDNGITLSMKVHQDFHKIYGYKNNNKEQLIEFLTKTIK